MINKAASYTDDYDVSIQLENMTNDLKFISGKLEKPDIDFEIKKCKKIVAKNLVSQNMNIIWSMITFFEQSSIAFNFARCALWKVPLLAHAIQL